jgi:hypothetical protein
MQASSLALWEHTVKSCCLFPMFACDADWQSCRQKQCMLTSRGLLPAALCVEPVAAAAAALLFWLSSAENILIACDCCAACCSAGSKKQQRHSDHRRYEATTCAGCFTCRKTACDMH